MKSVGRRHFVGAGLAAASVPLVFGCIYPRVQSSPKRFPDLTNNHLANLREAENLPPRVLVVGNSATIVSDFFEKLSVANPLATKEVHFSRAAAHGARLIETLRIAEFRALLKDVDWDVVVMQAFSSTALNSRDSQASTLAIQAITRLARPASIVLFPHWPSAPGHRVYEGGLEFGTITPKNMADYAAKSQAHYENVAKNCGGLVAPVLDDWLDAVNSGEELYLADRHHANQTGSKLAALAVWRTVSRYLQ